MASERLQQNNEIRYREAAKIFTQVRDIPYVLGLDGDPSKLLTENKGNCTRKHLYLVPYLQKLGYTVSLGIAEFNWRDLPIPLEILQLLKDPIDTHLFLYVSSKDNEMIVDATWDRGMSHAFQVNEWNGGEMTQLGVPAKKMYRANYQLLKLRATASAVLRSLRQNEIRKRPTPFSDAFNQWLGRSGF